MRGLQTVHTNSKWCTCSMRITTSSVTVLLYKEKEYKQVLKTFSKNVEGCRDGSAKNHRNQIWWWQCPGKRGYTRTTRVTPSLHLFFSSTTLLSHLIRIHSSILDKKRCRDGVTRVVLVYPVLPGHCHHHI